MEMTRKRHFPATAGEVGAMGEALRIVDLSVMWHGTRDRSWERFTRFVREEGDALLGEAIDLIRGKLEQGQSRQRGTPWWINVARGLFFNHTGKCLGQVWIEEHLLRTMLAVSQEFLGLSSLAAPAPPEQMGALRLRAFNAHTQLCSILPAGRPATHLRFFGCEDYGKIGPRVDVRRSA